MIKECVREIIFEEGTISNIVAEVVSGLNKDIIVESKALNSRPRSKKRTAAPPQNFSKKIKESKKKLLDAIGKDAYKGVNLFEGTSPLTNSQSKATSGAKSPLADIAPNDPGVNITNIPGFDKWKHLVK